MLNSFKKLLLISRPISWINTAYPFTATYLVTGGGLNLTLIIGTVFFLIPYNLLMYGINDVFDYESDIRNPRKGGIEGAIEQKTFHPIIIWSSIILSTPFIIYLLSIGNVTSNIVLIVLMFAVIAYSVVGLRFKEIPVLDSITSSLHFVGPMFYALSLTGVELSYLPYLIAFFIWGMSSHAFGAIQDILPDRQGNLSSIGTVLGAGLTVRIVSLFYLTSSIILILMGGLTMIVGFTSLLYFVNVIQFWNLSDEHSATSNIGWRRFIWLNMITGFVITMILIIKYVI